MAAKTKIATIKGVFLAPGKSANKRLYTPENIGTAVKAMQEQIASGTAPPVSMMTSHYDDSVLSTVGQITDCGQREDGSAWFQAAVPDTTAGHDLAVLASTGYVRNVSIAGNWEGEPRYESVNGEELETADGLRVRRIDYVPDPGVAAARIEDVMLESQPDGGFRDLIEDRPVELNTDDWVEATALEADAKKPYGDVAYADPGYQSDKKKRYPIDSAEHVRAAWSYINQAKNAGQYSAGDLAKVKARIRGAAKKFGVDIDGQKQSAEQMSLLETRGGSADPVGEPGAVNEHGDGYGEPKGPFPGAVRMDPDRDGDIDGWNCPNCGSIVKNTDTTTNPDADTDQFDWGAEARPRPTTKEAAPVTDTPAANAATENTQPKVAEGMPTTPEELQRLIDEAVAKATAPPKPKMPETPEELQAVITEAVQKATRPLPERKGIDTQTARENDGTISKPTWEMSPTELKEAAVRHAMSLPMAGVVRD